MSWSLRLSHETLESLGKGERPDVSDEGMLRLRPDRGPSTSDGNSSLDN